MAKWVVVEMHPLLVILSEVEGSLFKAPSGRELPTESGEGEGVQ